MTEADHDFLLLDARLDVGFRFVRIVVALLDLERDFVGAAEVAFEIRSEEHTSELQSLMRISYAVFCLKKKKNKETLRRQVSNKCRMKLEKYITILKGKDRT